MVWVDVNVRGFSVAAQTLTWRLAWWKLFKVAESLDRQDIRHRRQCWRYAASQLICLPKFLSLKVAYSVTVSCSLLSCVSLFLFSSLCSPLPPTHPLLPITYKSFILFGCAQPFVKQLIMAHLFYFISPLAQLIIIFFKLLPAFIHNTACKRLYWGIVWIFVSCFKE